MADASVLDFDEDVVGNPTGERLVLRLTAGQAHGGAVRPG